MDNKKYYLSFGFSLLAIVIACCSMFFDFGETKEITKVVEGSSNEKLNNTEFIVEDDYLKYRTSDDQAWVVLYDLNSLYSKMVVENKNTESTVLHGANGKDGTNGKDGVNGRDGIDGKDGADGNDGVDGENGTNGREVEFGIDDNYIVWRYVGEETWNELFDLASLVVENGNIVNPAIDIDSVTLNSSGVNCIKAGANCEVGTHIDIRVDGSNKYGFYVLEDTDGVLTLLMDSNLETTDKIKWYNSSSGDTSLGPVTSLEAMNGLTSRWSNIAPISNYYYDNTLERGYDESYQGLEIINGIGKLIDYQGEENALNGVSRARLLTLSEIKALGCMVSGSKCPTWLYNNLNDENPGYWLLTSAGSNGKNAYVISSSGDYKNYSAASSTGYGLRPVIYVKKIIEKN